MTFKLGTKVNGARREGDQVRGGIKKREGWRERGREVEANILYMLLQQTGVLMSNNAAPSYVGPGDWFCRAGVCHAACL
jgi:hypothetical protein